MTYTGQAGDWTAGPLGAKMRISMDDRAKTPMTYDLHRSSKRLDRNRDERQDGDLDAP